LKLKKLISLDKLFFMKRQIITACVFLHNEGKVLVGKRSNRKSFLPGKWELPGGHVEFSETIGQCLKRELQEEFKIDIILDKPYSEFTYVMNNGKDHVVEVLYFATMKNPNQKIELNRNELDEYKWISKNEVDSYFKDNDDEGSVVRKGFEMLKTEK